MTKIVVELTGSTVLSMPAAHYEYPFRLSFLYAPRRLCLHFESSIDDELQLCRFVLVWPRPEQLAQSTQTTKRWF